MSIVPNDCRGCDDCCRYHVGDMPISDPKGVRPASLTTDGDCFWLDKRAGNCRHYEKRPQICRDFVKDSEWCVLAKEEAARMLALVTGTKP